MSVWLEAVVDTMLTVLPWVLALGCGIALLVLRREFRK